MKFKINFYIIFLIFTFLSCGAQTTISLQQMEECAHRPNVALEGCPDLQDAKFVKDIGNRLDKFVGIWKGTANEKSYELKLEKKIDFGEYERKWDKIIGRISIKDSQGNIIYSSINALDSDTNFKGDNFQHNVYQMYFSANSYCGDIGDVFLEILSTPSDGSKMRLFYSQGGGHIDIAQCPNYNTYVPLLPTDWMTLTKQ